MRYNYTKGHNQTMSIFVVGLIVLFVMAAIFYIVLFGFIFYWHLRRVSFVVVPMIFSFEFLVKGFFVVSIIAMALEYLPVLIKATGI